MKHSKDIIKLALERLPEWEREQRELKNLIDKRVNILRPKKISKIQKKRDVYLYLIQIIKLTPKQKLLVKHLIIDEPIPHNDLTIKLKLKPQHNAKSPIGALKKLVSVTRDVLNNNPNFADIKIVSRKGCYKFVRKEEASLKNPSDI